MEDLRNTSYDRLKQIPTIGEAVARYIKNQLGQSEKGVVPDVDEGQKSLREYR
jgi:hypothetical protein